MKTIENSNTEVILDQCERPSFSTAKIDPVVSEVFEQVEKKGDEALKQYTFWFDKVKIEQFQILQKDIAQAKNELSDELKQAIQTAKENIAAFHASQLSTSSKVETTKGVSCWQETRAIEKVGLYIPGGTAPLFSTVLMLAVPAKIAGCKEIVLCTPPDKNGNINPAILFAAELTGVDKVYKVGGIQAIAAMTFGTESIPAVNKIFGPGNQYVTAAKMRAIQYGVSIDMPAGPSELLLLADETADPSFVASDLLSQAEHGSDSQVICVLIGKQISDQVLTEIDKQLVDLPRKELAVEALSNSKMIIAKDMDQAIEIINGYAPEHLILNLKDAEALIPEIENAGSVFVGGYTPESAGDYASGTNHTLPTGGFARSYSGVNMDAFVKKITFQKITKEGILELGSTIEIMAEAEQLQAHKNAVTLRLKAIANENN